MIQKRRDQIQAGTSVSFFKFAASPAAVGFCILIFNNIIPDMNASVNKSDARKTIQALRIVSESN
jgi:hypothetical protein